MATINIPQQNFPTGTRTFGPIAVSSGLTGFSIEVARCTTATPTIWPNSASVMDITLDCSYDGGNTYHVGQFAWQNHGGILTDRHTGQEIPTWIVSAQCDPPPTQIKGAFTVTNGPILTSMKITTV